MWRQYIFYSMVAVFGVVLLFTSLTLYGGDSSHVKKGSNGKMIGFTHVWVAK
ncbi:MAG: hypothetical protein OEZ43_09310 [Gammaproteobacteria bacterium]|nr:hypothetical protein [Gammaproteobacteria bacterium]